MTVPVPGYAAPQFRVVPGQTGIVVHARRIPIAIGVGVRIQVDGQLIPNARWGTNFLPGPPGVHTVTVYSTQILEYGHGDITVQVFPGHTTEVHYTTPANMFARGAIGPERQRAPGQLLGVLIMVLVGVLTVTWMELLM